MLTVKECIVVTDVRACTCCGLTRMLSNTLEDGSVVNKCPACGRKRRKVENQKSHDWYWENYVAKLKRLDELKALGRYGYQLRMPKKAIASAHQAMHDWCHANKLTCTICEHA